MPPVINNYHLSGIISVNHHMPPVINNYHLSGIISVNHHMPPVINTYHLSGIIFVNHHMPPVINNYHLSGIISVNHHMPPVINNYHLSSTSIYCLLSVQYSLQRIVIFLIIAPYKNSYLLIYLLTYNCLQLFTADSMKWLKISCLQRCPVIVASSTNTVVHHL